MASEFDQIRNILTETIILLCKNSLSQSNKFSIEGVIGITVNEKDILLIHINEQCLPGHTLSTSNNEEFQDELCDSTPNFESTPKQFKLNGCADFSRRRKRKRQRNVSAMTSLLSKVESTSFVSKFEQLNAEEASDNYNSINAEQSLQDSNVKLEPHLVMNCESTIQHSDSPLSTRNYLYVSKHCNDSVTLQNEYLDSYLTGDNDISENVTGCSVSGINPCTMSNALGHSFAMDHNKKRFQNSFRSSGLYPFSSSQRSRRSSNVALGKKFICDYESCSKMYYERKNLLRHQTIVHGRRPDRSRTRSSHFPVMLFTNDNCTE